MFEVLLHEDFQASTRKTLRRYRALQKQLVAVLNRLENGPGSKHSPLKGMDDLGAQGVFRRMRVGKHRMIYGVYAQDRVILLLYLSDRPRNEATYRDWQGPAMKIIVDYERQQHDLFESWQGKL